MSKTLTPHNAPKMADAVAYVAAHEIDPRQCGFWEGDMSKDHLHPARPAKAALVWAEGVCQ